MISVIIPTYNCEKYIGEAIDSVLHQTCLDYEVIVIDDGSTDATRSIIESRYQTVRYFYVENKGVASARNYGIAKAKGNLIAFLDADDIWLPEKLEKQKELFDRNQALGMVFTENSFFYEHGIIANKLNKRESLMRGDIVRNIFLHSYVVTSTVMVRRSIFDVVGLFDEELLVAEDDNMWMRIGIEYGIALLDEPLVRYRKTTGSLSSDLSAVSVGVNKHVELMKSRYPDLYDRIGPLAIRIKYSDQCFSEGYRDFSRGNYAVSRTRFIDSYMNNPFRLTPLIFYISTYLPAQIIEIIRGMKREVNKKTALGRSGSVGQALDKPYRGSV